MDITRRPNKKVEGLKDANIHRTLNTQYRDIEKAVAFRIDDDSAEVISIGIGHFAEQIKKQAEEHGIPIYENKELAEKLINFDINVPLPPEAYDLIVAFINFVSYVERDIYKRKS
ncbi:MAG: EscU/YscU/HrcU family type III secretion system export apparatus switch protein [Candidatus Calescibacterium sp.]|nr:EscU/YscU/HrcU family type III secretion system export apparatus switch protein [Candidatus Calescibacterium sp.]MCX7972747.1 EscU/YscU/HrcU family type III secretion system export apparatus switch protein [bacterium]MDW8195206.1 EscU/YscU/HrcU family type III secretion system export apparatus switch protein [Candidatus Calescibacterium sp.]